MTKQKRITQADRLVVYVSHHPGITTPEVCDAFNTDSGSTGQQLAALVQRGVMTRSKVNGETRVHEIARMLSGSESEASLDHARELLSDSRLTLPLAGAGAAGD